jgi:gliding motility-associated-like protein
LWNGVALPQGNHPANLYAGNYHVIVNDGNCSAFTDLIVGNILGPTALFEPVPAVALSDNPEFRFQNQSIGGISYLWSFGDGLNSSEENPIHHYFNNQTVNTVWLLVTDNFGCTDSVSHIVKVVDDIHIYIPNTFTPDQDGLNDEFKPKGVGYDESGYVMVVYDRWGQQVFYSHRFEKGWDGRVKGVKLNTNGVFTYLIKIYDLKGVEHQFAGHVTLLGSSMFGF